LYHVAANAINAHATTTPITGPAIHAFEEDPCDESLVAFVFVAPDAAVADGGKLNAVVLVVDPVVVALEPVVVVALVVAGV
jgi:hypothetical protein